METFSHFSSFLHERLRKQKAPPTLINSHSRPRSTVLFILLFFSFFQQYHKVTICALIIKRGKKQKTRRQPPTEGAEATSDGEFGRKRQACLFLVRGKRHIKKVIFGFNLPKGIMYPEKFEKGEKNMKEENII